MAKETLITGVFKSSDQAARAIEALLQGGIARDDISIVASEGTKVEAFGIQKHTKAAEAAAIGGGLGGAVGALIAGFTAVGALATGGLGLIAAGPIVAALAGAGAGAAAGGVLGGLIGLGIPEHEVKFYEDALNKGSVLVGVKTDPGRRQFIEETFQRFGAEKPSAASRVASPSTTAAPATRTAATGTMSADDWAQGNPLRKLFIHQLQDMYYAEQQLADTLPKLRDHSSQPELARAFESHLAETREHVQRLESIFNALGVKAKAEKCPAINGIIAEGKELMGIDATPAVRDAAIICAAQKAEHYEIATYGCLRAYAETLSLTQVAATLQETLDEEVDADQTLSDIAQRGVNVQAASPTGAAAAPMAEPKPRAWVAS